MENKTDFKNYDDLNKSEISGKVIKDVELFTYGSQKEKTGAKFTILNQGKFVNVVTFHEYAANLWKETIAKDILVSVVGKMSAETYDKKDNSGNILGKGVSFSIQPEINGVTILPVNVMYFEDQNNITVVGGITVDAPTQFMRDGKKSYAFNMASTVNGKTVYFKVVTDSTISVAVAETLQGKGCKVKVTGTLNEEVYTKEDKTVYSSATINAQLISVVPKKLKTESFNSGFESSFEPSFEPSGGFLDPSGFQSIDDDDIPF